MQDNNPLPAHLRCTLAKKAKIGSTQDILKIAAPKSTQFLYNAMRVGPRVILRSAFELLKANTLTRILSAAVLLSIDTVSLIKGRISYKQYIINVTLALMLVVGGTAGWFIGGHVAAQTLIENAAIGILAALAGAGIIGAGAAYVWEKFIKLFFRSDTEEMIDLFNLEFYNHVTEHKMGEENIAKLRDSIELTTQTTKEMFICKDKKSFARNIICQAAEKAN